MEHEEKIDKLSILSDLVKNKAKHALGRIKLLPQEVYSITKYLQSLLTYPYVPSSKIFAR